MEINASIFREYDIRGVYPSDLNEESIKTITKAIASKCHSEGINEIILGRDGRNSGESLLSACAETLSKYGISVYDIGIVTSPMLYYASKKSAGKSGIMITGSHNPKDYNGIKLVINDKPVSGTEILSLVNKNNFKKLPLGFIKKKSIKNEYLQDISSKINLKKPIKIVVDSGNGAAGCIASDLFKSIGCEVVDIFSDVDGNFPNHHPDPSKIENLIDLKNKIRSEQADLGIAFDGDGDRVGLVTEKEEVVFPDKILMILAIEILKNNKGKKIIYDVKCSKDLENIIKNHGGVPIMSPTGHFHIKNNIKKHDAVLAGEMSGHIFISDSWYGFDDGPYTAARIVEILSRKDSSLSKIINKLPKSFSTPELNIKVSDQIKFKIIDKFIKECKISGHKLEIDGVRIEKKDCWGLIRASNTSPNLVMRFEGNTEEALEKIKNEFISELSRIFPDLDVLLY